MSSNDEQDEKERLSRAMMPEMQRLMLEAIEALTSRVTTNETETRKRMEFIIEHQAAFATGIQQLQEQQAATVERMAALENLVTRLAAVTHTGFQEVRGSIAALVDAQMHTDENLKNLIAVADRYFSEGRNGGNGSNGQA